ncbi:hypothetical protein N752_16155 [Desulforamulus aquiferis]|nr:3-hydroxyacyl-CoA dehydrogenase family protein [Desulforamulus aquiferis]RYD04114.1 hypothetical protein N752_16155 [Desulforamulus aquiferis]
MKAKEIKTICNLGTGNMGFGTALMFALSGYQVKMFGRSEESIKRGFKNIRAALETYRINGLVQEVKIPEIMSRIEGVTTLQEAAVGTDFVIESIAENLHIKQQVFTELETYCSPKTIFATNTSGLSPTAIAEPLKFKDRFIVAHFWNPPHLMPLVEVVPGLHTTQQTVDIACQLMELIGKKPVLLNNEALGFIGNRLQLALLREAFYIVEAGIASKEAVDTAVKYSLGRRLSTTGPFESADLGGLDIFLNISNYLLKDLSSRTEPSHILKSAVEQGNLGAKTGTGLYQWTPEGLENLKRARENNLIELLKRDQENK